MDGSNVLMTRTREENSAVGIFVDEPVAG